MRKIILGASISVLAIVALGFYSISARADDRENQNREGGGHDRPVNRHEDNRDNRNKGIFNPDKQLSKSACGANLGKPVIDVKQKVQNDVDSGEGGNNWAFDYYTRNIKVWPVGKWNVSGAWVFDYNYNGGVNLHDMTLSQDGGGALTGSGGNPAGGAYIYPWTITSGSVNGNTINFTAGYTATVSCSFTATGTIASNGTMSGTWTDNCDGTRNGTWATTIGAATGMDKYCAIVTYDGNFYAIPGQVGPGNTPPGALINTPTNAPVNGDMSGGYRATFNGTFAPTDWPANGSVGTTNYQCDILANCPGRVDWVGKYFPGYTSFDQPWWGWKYSGGSHGTWINAITGNSGNIL